MIPDLLHQSRILRQALLSHRTREMRRFLVAIDSRQAQRDVPASAGTRARMYHYAARLEAARQHRASALEANELVAELNRAVVVALGKGLPGQDAELARLLARIDRDAARLVEDDDAPSLI